MKQLCAFLAAFALFAATPIQAEAVKVVVDPGHGGHDSGAIGVNGIYEKTVNTDIAAKLRDELIRRGYDVVMTKEGEDIFLTLAERVDKTRAIDADLFVSVHANAYPSSSSIRGTMVLYYDDAYPQEQYPASDEMKKLTPQSRELAQDVLDHVVAEIGTEDKGLLPSAAYVIRNGDVPSILVETAFLTNPKDAALLANPDFRSRMAVAIANGIQAYAPPIFADLAGHWAREAVLRVKDRGIISGDSSRFYPDRALTRAELVMMLSRMFDFDRLLASPQAKPASTGSAPSSPGKTKTGATASAPSETKTATPVSAQKPADANVAFSDLKRDHWAYNVMQKAILLGILNGYEDGKVKPDKPVTRAEVAVLFDRLRNMGKTAQPNAAANATNNVGKGKTVFADVPVNLWSAAAIANLYQSGLIEGDAIDRFAPDRGMTRAEMAAMIDRYYRNP